MWGQEVGPSCTGRSKVPVESREILEPVQQTVGWTPANLIVLAL